jgi:hypothetical protein
MSVVVSVASAEVWDPSSVASRKSSAAAIDA